MRRLSPGPETPRVTALALGALYRGDEAAALRAHYGIAK
jgi:hypothetical protein